MTFHTLLDMPARNALLVLIPLTVLPGALAPRLLRGGKAPEPDADGWTALSHIGRLKWLGLCLVPALPFAYAAAHALAESWGLWTSILPAFLCLPLLVLCIRGLWPSGVPSAAFGPEGLRIARMKGAPTVIPWRDIKRIQENKLVGLIVSSSEGPLVLDKRWPGVSPLMSEMARRTIPGADSIDLPPSCFARPNRR